MPPIKMASYRNSHFGDPINLRTHRIVFRTGFILSKSSSCQPNWNKKNRKQANSFAVSNLKLSIKDK